MDPNSWDSPLWWFSGILLGVTTELVIRLLDKLPARVLKGFKKWRDRRTAQLRQNVEVFSNNPTLVLLRALFVVMLSLIGFASATLVTRLDQFVSSASIGAFRFVILATLVIVGFVLVSQAVFLFRVYWNIRRGGVTVLLFPFVANVTGYDTGISIVNTSKGQSGPVMLYCYKGFVSPGPAPAPATHTIASIESGNTWACTLSSLASFAGSTGYIVAVCQFRGACGVAVLTQSDPSQVRCVGCYLATATL